MSDWTIHDNKNPPKLPEGSSVFCLMGDGTTMYGEIEDIDWCHETDPVRAYRVGRLGPPQPIGRKANKA